MGIDINWEAVIIVSLIYFITYFFWYFPFAFGNMWLKLVGKESEPKSKIIRDIILMIPSSFITVLILAFVMELAGIDNIGSALLLALIL